MTVPGGVCLPGDLGRVGLGLLADVVPAALVDEVLAQTGRCQVRVRRLPARVVVYFVLALTLWSTLSYRQVWRQLTGHLPGLGRAVSRSALSQARRRLGPQPLRGLFDRVRGPRGVVGQPGVFFAGLRVVAWDGTTFAVADSQANAAVFTRGSGGQDKPGGYPYARVLVLAECGTHAVIDARVGGNGVGEQELARQMLGSLGEGMLLLADRNFLSYDLWNKTRAAGAHLLWRVKANRVPKPTGGGVLADGSWLAVLPDPVAAQKRRDQARRKRFAGHDFGPPEGVPVRVVQYTVTVHTTGDDGQPEQRTETIVLVTSLLDPADAGAPALAELYQQRWESENGYRELKVFQRGAGVVLRSHDPQGVEQELWAYLITYQAMRGLLTDAAEQAAVDGDELSFTAVINVVRRKISTGPDLPRARQAALDEIIDERSGPRRPRTSPRTVKRPVSPYPSAKRRPGQKVTHPATCTVQINQPKLPTRA
ncbi:IS4 family transposase [Catellatospora aurea]|uniref:IS4 family transposase n=1 Tax=Catellatospora aurea TaxID=1337874 RepID=A0ABW2H7F9_9ACTN